TCTFTNNRAGDGGAVGTFNTGGTLGFTGCTVTGNTAATGDGGGIQNQGATTVTIDNCAITGNTANSGGGVALQGGTITVSNSIVANNQSASTVGHGGGISADGGASLNIVNSTVAGGGGIDVTTPSGSQSSITFCTIAGNSVGDPSASGGGLLVEGAGTLTLYNTVVAGNSLAAGGRGATGPDIAGSVMSRGFNFIGDGGGATVTGNLTGVQVGAAGRPLDPRLGPLQNNGGRT